MKINYIKIRGAIGIKKGQGVDEIEFNLKEKIGLVALSGPNGSGKSTVLELFSPYRTFASRKGALHHHFFLRDSFIETRFDYNGSEYHTIRKIDSGSERTEAFITVDGESVVNGKVKEYDKYIINLFGTQTLFYNSVFCAQNSGNLSDMRTGEIKELFVEFLRIERLAEYEHKAKAGIAFYQQKLDSLNGEITALLDAMSELDGTEADLARLKTLIEADQETIEDISNLIKKAEKDLGELRAAAIENQHKIEKKAELEKLIDGLTADMSAVINKRTVLTKNHQAKESSLREDLANLLCITDKKDEILQADTETKKLKEKEKSLAELRESTIDKQAGINKDMAIIDKEIVFIDNHILKVKTDEALVLLKNSLAGLQGEEVDLQIVLSSLGTKLKTAQNDFQLYTLSKQVDDCKEKIALAIDPECVSTTCPALDVVANAKKALPALEKEAANLKVVNDEKIKTLEKELVVCEERISGHGEEIALSRKEIAYREEARDIELEGLEKNRVFLVTSKDENTRAYLEQDRLKGGYKAEIIVVREDIEKNQVLAGQKSELEVAEAQAKAIEQQIIDLKADHRGREVELTEQIEDFTADITVNTGAVKRLEEEINKNIEELIFSLISKEDIYNRRKKEVVKVMESHKNKEAVLKHDLERLDKIKADYGTKTSVLKEIGTEILEWDYLRLACSKTGLQALEIDGAAPLITAEANTLLEQAFGLDSQIKIVTQDPESGREVFWIKVIREDGSEDDFGNLSGGQKVWIAKALSLGMTLVSKRKSGRDFKTLFADEEDGSLDSQKALDFIQLYRTMMLTGDFETCFFISHNPEVVAMADSEIKF